MKVLVTGAAGFMGSWLVDSLVEDGHSVFGVDNLSGGYLRNVNKKSKFTKLDLRDKKAVDKYISKVKPELVYHLAADATEGRSQFTPQSATENNYVAFMNLIVPCIRNKMRKILVTSSMSVYGAQKPPFSESQPTAPEDVYGLAKSAMEKATEILSDVHGFDYTVLRPHNVYGPRQNLADPYRNAIGIFINCLMRRKNFYIYGDGKQKRAFSYIDDFTPYAKKAGMIDKANGEIMNIGPVEEVTLNHLADVVLQEFFDGDTPGWAKPVYLPPRPREVKYAYCTVDKAKRLLGYKTTIGLNDGIRRMIEWAREIGPQKPYYLDSLELVTKDVPLTWKKKLI